MTGYRPATINSANRIADGRIIQANLADVGLDLEIVPMAAGPFWNLGLETESDERNEDAT